MKGRKASVHPNRIIEAVLRFKDRVIMEFNRLTKKNGLVEESLACEMWKRKSKNQRKSNSYLVPNPHIKYIDLNNSKTKKSLPILKNGSRFEELKSCKTKHLSRKVVFSNTCAFDAITSIIMVSYCDSAIYSNLIDLTQLDYFNFVEGLVKQGVSSLTYSTRADLILNYLKPEIRTLEYATTLAVCDSTVGNVISKLLVRYPSITEVIKCTSNLCPNISEQQVTFITYQSNLENNISQLQQFLNDRVDIVELKCGNNCNGLKTITSNISNMHLFIDILYWEGDEIISSQRSSEAATLMKLKLRDIPEVLIYGSITYKLRGVINYHQGENGLRNSVGHYTAYAKRGSRNWELYDDLEKKPIPVKENATVICEFLVFTV